MRNKHTIFLILYKQTKNSLLNYKKISIKKSKTPVFETRNTLKMKFVLAFLALVACANAASVVMHSELDQRIELPSPSALIVTELLEVTFKVDPELAKQIGHLFRDVPLSVAKEMVAFIAKVFADISLNNMQNMSVYLAQAMSIFSLVWQHMNVVEVIDLVASNVLSDKWAKIVMTLINMIAPKALCKPTNSQTKFHTYLYYQMQIFYLLSNFNPCQRWYQYPCQCLAWLKITQMNKWNRARLHFLD